MARSYFQSLESSAIPSELRSDLLHDELGCAGRTPVESPGVHIVNGLDPLGLERYEVFRGVAYITNDILVTYFGRHINHHMKETPMGVIMENPANDCPPFTAPCGGTIRPSRARV